MNIFQLLATFCARVELISLLMEMKTTHWAIMEVLFCTLSERRRLAPSLVGTNWTDVRDDVLSTRIAMLPPKGKSVSTEMVN